jgi:hypothetical protein
MTTAVNSYTTAQENGRPVLAQDESQYRLGQILGIWALATLPMVLMTWVVAPIIIPYSPLHPGITFWLLMIAGMAWQFVMSLALLYRELGTLRWSAVRERLWLQTPRDPATDEPNPRLYWLLLPLILFDGLVAMVFANYLDAPMTWLFPALRPAPFMEMSQLVSPEFQGQWWVLGLTLVSFLFNYWLGEAFLWHGILLPKMRGVFGRYDWLANAVLFGLYHLHKPWALPSVIITNLAYSWPARRFRSNWMAVAVHGAEAFPTLIMVLAVILGWVG